MPTLRTNATVERGAGNNRQVNNLLNTLRGEHFRHIQNITGSKPRPPALVANKPSLPFAQIFGGTADGGTAEVGEPQPGPARNGNAVRRRPPVTLIEGVPTYAYPDGAVPGPRPPKSWTALFESGMHNGPAWRHEALSLLFTSLAHPPAPWLDPDYTDTLPLSLMCAQVVVQACEGVEELREVAAYMPVQARRDLVRWCAVHTPLASGVLYALLGEQMHADGELIVVGPQASLKADVFKGKERAHMSGTGVVEDGDSETRGDDGWDTDWDTPTPLTVLGLVNVSLSASLFLSFPPTLTHLALVALPQSVPIHHLPPICPLLEVLDLSYNTWLTDRETNGASRLLDGVDWRRWRYLRVLGLRECGIPSSIIKKVNAERWDDVDILGLSGDPSRSMTVVQP